jgi:O-6-methylguanine DNA methyltransferase
MIDVYVKKADGVWFGLAHVGEKILATVVTSTKGKAVRSVLEIVPPHVEYRIVKEGSEFAEKTILLLRELESGNEEFKEFSLATDYFPELLARVFQAASAIPIGYVTSYGNIAKAAGTDPRTVGRAMATNPLYPIVTCHRVVGADFSLVGYGGTKNLSALREKLARLNKEAKGFLSEKEVLTDGRKLVVYPVEHVIKKAAKLGSVSFHQENLSDYAKSNRLM